jgi:hypothetical protein
MSCRCVVRTHIAVPQSKLLTGSNIRVHIGPSAAPHQTVSVQTRRILVADRPIPFAGDSSPPRRQAHAPPAGRAPPVS